MQANLRSGKSRSRGQNRKPSSVQRIKDVIGRAAGVGVVRADPQRRAVVHQPIEHVWRFVARRRHDARAVRAVLVRDV